MDITRKGHRVDLGSSTAGNRPPSFVGMEEHTYGKSRHRPFTDRLSSHYQRQNLCWNLHIHQKIKKTVEISVVKSNVRNTMLSCIGPGDECAYPGICAGYEVTTGGQAFTLNRRHKQPKPDTQDMPVTSPVSDDKEVAAPCTNGQTESSAGSPAPRRSDRKRKKHLDWGYVVFFLTQVRYQINITFYRSLPVKWYRI